MGAMLSCFAAGHTVTRGSNSSDSEDQRFDPRKKGYNPYAIASVVMGDADADASPVPKSNILLPLYVYPSPGAWTPLQQT